MSICGIILAAGLSSRAGIFKLTFRICSKPVIEHVVETMSHVCQSIIVVTGYQAEKLSYLGAQYENIRLIRNERYNEGMFGSVKSGLNLSDADRFFIIPGDCACVSPRTYSSLAQADGDIVVPVYNGRKGHPVLIGRAAAASILESRFPTLRDHILAAGFRTFETDDAGILMDIDCPEDIARAELYLSGRHTL